MVSSTGQIRIQYFLNFLHRYLISWQHAAKIESARQDIKFCLHPRMMQLPSGGVTRPIAMARIKAIPKAVNRYNEETQGINETTFCFFEMDNYAYQAYLSLLRLQKAAGYPTSPDSPLFPMRNHQSLYARWKSYQRANDIPEISLYELRHACATIFAQD